MTSNISAPLEAMATGVKAEELENMDQKKDQRPPSPSDVQNQTHASTESATETPTQDGHRIGDAELESEHTVTAKSPAAEPTGVNDKIEIAEDKTVPLTASEVTKDETSGQEKVKGAAEKDLREPTQEEAQNQSSRPASRSSEEPKTTGSGNSYEASEQNGSRGGQKRELPLRAEDALKQQGKKPRHDTTPPTVKAEVIVDNRPVLELVSSIPRRAVGFVVYEPNKPLLVNLETQMNGVVQVGISHWFLNEDAIHETMRRRPLWGTEVYTDDSDLIACLIHQSKLTRPVKGDLLVSVLVLPPLDHYTGSYSNEIQSRTWTTAHDGPSFMILDDPREMSAGWASSAIPASRLQRLKDLEDLRSGVDVALLTE